MLKRAILVLALLGASAVAIAAKPVPPNPHGQPEAMEVGKQVAFYVWSDGNKLHLRWTAAGKPTLFTGTLEVTGAAGEITRINQLAGGWVDKKDENHVMFSATATTSLDGADIALASGSTVNMFLEVDGVSADVNTLFVGAKLEHPAAFPYKFKTK